MFFKTSDFNRSMLAKWALSLILPLGVYLLLPRDGSLSQPMMAFLAITLWAVCAWAMDTLNEIAVGILLPALAKPLREAGLDRINMSLDTLDADQYRFVTRCGSLDAARTGLESAIAAGFLLSVFG